MTSPAQAKGDRAEREIVSLLRSLSGWPIERRYGAGRSQDSGDLVGLPSCCAQVKDYRDPLRAQRDALLVLPTQQLVSGCDYGVAFIRHRGGRWVAVMTPEQFVTLLREATG